MLHVSECTGGSSSNSFTLVSTRLRGIGGAAPKVRLLKAEARGVEN